MTPSSIQMSSTCCSRYVYRAMSSRSRIMSSCALPTRVLRVRLLPVDHELSQRLVGAFRRRNVDLDELVAASTGLAAGHAFAAQPQLRALLGTLRHLHVYRSVYSLHAHARTIQRLTQRHRQRAQDIKLLALETGVRPHRDLDVGAARLAVGARQSLSFEAQNLPVADACRDRNVECLAVRHRHSLARAIHRIEKIDLERIADVLRRRPKGWALTAATEEIGEDVVIEIRPFVAALPCRRIATPVAPARIGFGVLAVEVPLRLALGPRLIDLPGVITLALVRIANDIVGSIDLLEAPFRLGFAGVEIGMGLLGSLAICRADVLLARVGSHVQRFVGIGHRSRV